MPYYDDLSGESSDEACSSSSDEGESNHNSIDDGGRLNDIWNRSVVHLDVDCFYCQCEEIDRNLRQAKPTRALAIGQKHIIVTCNYEARRRGVKKLQSRDSAMAACPDLWIVEGSDLQRYRRHSRSIYEAFRRALAQISAELFSDEGGRSVIIPARKGAMDEMMADLSPAISQMIKMNYKFRAESKDIDQALFLYGETLQSSRTVLVEDQTGQEAVVSFWQTGGTVSLGLPETRRNIHEAFGSESDRLACMKRLKAASHLVSRICCYIRQESGFHTTGGVSVSPLLAKIASDLNKPKSVNILYPWRSSALIYSMPLRKMHSIGYGTAKALKSSISQETNNEKETQTVRDLLALPRGDILKSLEAMRAFQSSSEEKCDFLIDRCRGLDASVIVDDEGGAQKTLSIENSFRRGTVRNMEAIWRGLLDLFVRLPLLLRDRASWSCDPDKAYPKTIRLTMRMVDKKLTQKRRPYATHSKQAPFNGKELLKEKDPNILIQILKRSISPLLSNLLQLSSATDINITRMNIALTNFQDVSSHITQSPPSRASLAAHFQPKRALNTNDNHALDCTQQTPAAPPAKRSRDFSYSQKDGTNQKDDGIICNIANKPGEPLPSWRSTPSKLPVLSNRKQTGRPRVSSKPPRMKSTTMHHFFSKK